MMESGGVPMTMPVQPANTGNGGGFGWGGDGAWWIIILFLFVFCGWGNGGLGGGYSERGYSRDGGYSERRDSHGRYSRNDGRMPEYDRGSSYANRGQHWVRGHYSRAEGPDSYQRYMGEKQSYRAEGKSEDCKHRMLEALEDHLEMLTKEISDMGADADCREERETIKRYMEKLRNMM